MNILLVEDNEADRRLIQEAFAATDSDVRLHMAIDGESALHFLFQQNGPAEMPRPELILLDLNLPGTHGKDVLREIKENPEMRNIPVIIFTSSTFQNDICESYHLNANCFLAKPLRYAELLKTVKLICDFWIKEVRYCGV